MLLLVMVTVFLALVVKEEVVMEWLALLCLPRTLWASLIVREFDHTALPLIITEGDEK